MLLRMSDIAFIAKQLVTLKAKSFIINVSMLATLIKTPTVVLKKHVPILSTLFLLLKGHLTSYRQEIPCALKKYLPSESTENTAHIEHSRTFHIQNTQICFFVVHSVHSWLWSRVMRLLPDHLQIESCLLSSLRTP